MADQQTTSATDDAATQNQQDAGTQDPPETQDDGLSDAGRDAIRKERRAARDATKRATELEARLKELEDRDKTEAQRLTERAAELEREANAAKGELMRYQIAADKKLPADLVEFLTGDSREELEAKADKLLERFNAQQQPPRVGGHDGGPRGTTSAPADMNTLMRQATGRA